jgi:hypothetical protein
MNPSRQVNILIGLGLFAATAIPLYWVLWFLAPDWIQAFPPGSTEYAGYVAYEQAFLLADAWLTLCAIWGSIGLLRKRGNGVLWMLLAGSSAVFLGLMDLLYDLENGVFVTLTPAGMIELLIAVLVLGLGSAAIVLSWRLRGRFSERAAYQLPAADPAGVSKAGA